MGIYIITSSIVVTNQYGYRLYHPTKALCFACTKQKYLTVLRRTHFWLLGPNGAAKPTIMLLVTGLISQQNGSIHLFDEPRKRQQPDLLSKAGNAGRIASLASTLHLKCRCDYHASAIYFYFPAVSLSTPKCPCLSKVLLKPRYTVEQLD